MDNIISIHYNSDWEFEYPLPASYDNCPFKITLYTIDYEDNRYEAYFDGTSYVNCTKTDSNSIIVHIDNFTFYPGCVRVRVEYFIDSASFNDGIYNGIHAEKTNIYTTKAKSETTAVTFEGSSLPNFDAVNIANNVETALNDINDKSEELEEALSTLSDANEQAETLLDELNEWKETTDNLVDKDTLDEYAKLTDLNQYMTEDEVSDWLENYYTKTECNTRYYTKTQIDAMLNEINPTVDLSDYATKEDLANAITGSGNITLDDYVSKAELSSCGYLTQHQSLNDYATKNWVYSQNFLSLDYIDENDVFHVDLDGYVKYEDLNLDDYATKTWVGNQGFLTQHQSLEGLASQSWVQNQHYLTQHQSLANYVTTSALNNRLNSYATTDYVESRIQEISGIDLSSYATKAWVQNQGFLTDHQSLDDYATKAYVLEKLDDIDIQNINIDLSSYVSKVELSNCGYLTSHQSLDDYATKAYVVEKINNIEITGGVDLSSYATKNDLNSYVKKSNDDEVVITGDGITLGSIDAINLYADSGVYSYDIYPVTGNGNLGGWSSAQWAYTYTKNLILNGTDINDKFPTYAYIENALQNANVNVDLSAYVTKTQLSNCGYLTSHQSLDNYVTKTQLSNQSYITMANVSACGYLTQHQSLNNYVTKTQLSNCGYLTSHQSLDNYPTYGYVYSYVADAVSGIETTTYEVSYTTYTTQNITIWQGTAAQYAALSNHTAFQLYLIAQS